MSTKRSVLLWLLKLPFRPYLRWLTGLVAVLLVVAYLTGYLGHGSRYLWGRLWPFGTPLIEYAPQDARAIALIDLTRPGADRLTPLLQQPTIKARIDALGEALDINPQRDVLQILVASGSPTDGSLIVVQGLFSPDAVRTSLEKRGYQASELPSGPLLVHAETAEAIHISGGSILLYGQSGAISRALERAQGRSGNLGDDQAFARWLDRIGSRHTVLALRVTPKQQAALSALAAGGAEHLEATAFALDTNGEHGIQLELTLGPANPAEVAPLRAKADQTIGAIKTGLRLISAPRLKPLLDSMAVLADAHCVKLATETSPDELARFADTVERPGALVDMLGGFAMAVASGVAPPSLIPATPPPAPTPTPAPGADPVAPAPGVTADQVVDALKDMLQPAQPATGSAQHDSAPNDTKVP